VTNSSLSATQTDRSFRISVDTGGTFTDVVVSDTHGQMAVGKSFTTPDRVFEGFSNSVGVAAAHWSLSASELLKQTDTIIYATTHATNAVVTRKTARTVLLTTKGFEDTLTYREGGRIGAFNARASYPDPFVPRGLTFGVLERISAEGTVLEPLTETELERVVEHVAQAAPEAVAVMFLWAISNPAHEALIAKRLAEAFPEISISVSHQVNPVIREYRRASSVSIDASLKPLMRRHFNLLASDLEAAGFTGDCLAVTSEGGVQTLEGVANKPILAVNSGPSMAPLAGASFVTDGRPSVVCDIGGTTFDVSMVEDGKLRHTRELWLGEPFIGELAGLASVAVKSVGAGGGSIASIDSGGLLQVGPQSAGSYPGPAAYCNGGTQATITDAAVVLGYLDAEAVNGAFSLDRDRASAAIRANVSGPLDMTVEAASAAVLQIASTQSAMAARQTILEHGVDPRDSVMVACGGAGPLLACLVASELEINTVVIPSNAGVLAAYGAHNATILTEFNMSLPFFSDAPQFPALVAMKQSMEEQVAAFVARFEAYNQDFEADYFFEARYPGQGWEIRVMMGSDIAADAATVQRAVAAFHLEHLKRNGVNDPGSPIEFVTWGVRVSIPRDRRVNQLTLDAASTPTGRSAEAWFDGKAHSLLRYRGTEIAPAWSAQGPVIIDEPTTTIVVLPGWAISRAGDGSFHITRNAGEKA
jgi:N-methylhydantoinase A